MNLRSVNATELTNLVNTCSGRVCIVTSDGDCLVFNSKLSDRIGLDTILKVAEHRDVTIQCDDQQDQQRIDAYLSASN
ncbi:MAG: hypothetical protein GXY22_06675 [Clostridiaceae bacterium]|jgi:hypothetical protein|nr:hypothetical protein [Eubacteriales bacterium]NLV48322.1 hypothetical protein [Clostridiaceae bacterium]